MPSKACLSAILPYKSSGLFCLSFVCVCVCAYIWEIWWNRQIISMRGKQVRSKKHQWIKANRSLKKILSFFCFFPFFIFFSPLLFSSYVHAPCAHYRERKRQVCIILNEFVVVDVHLAFAALLKLDFSVSFLSSFPHFFFFLHRFMHLALIIRRGIYKYAFLSS